MLSVEVGLAEAAGVTDKDGDCEMVGETVTVLVALLAAVVAVGDGVAETVAVAEASVPTPGSVMPERT